ncbi:MAG TPA: hypothetical protein VEB59_00635 [Gemmatimonadales bacterium]|nr:hypothetical protein [Gemmatimonadales bacterium]
MHAYGRSTLVLALGLAAVAATGCKKDAPPPPQEEASAPAPAPAEFKVSGIEVGKGIGADKRVTAPASSFKPKDTIYVSVATDGAAASKTITAKWTYEDGQTVKEGSESIAPTGPAVTEFHIAKPSGWPEGKYKVEIAVDGAAAGSKDFEVKK